MLGPAGLTPALATFTRREVIQGLAERTLTARRQVARAARGRLPRARCVPLARR